MTLKSEVVLCFFSKQALVFHFQTRSFRFYEVKVMEHIRRSWTEGKMKNIGIPTQPVYVPVTGYYGVSWDRIVTK